MPVITGNIENEKLLTVISKKIHTNNKAKSIAFVLSLLIHSSLVAAILYFTPQKVIRPLEIKDEKIISISFYSPAQKNTKTQTKVTKTKPKTLQTKKTIKPKKQVIKKIKSLQKSSITPKSVVSSSEVIPAVNTQVEPIVNNEIKDFDSPKSLKKLPLLEQEISPHVLGQIRTMIQNSLIYPSIAKRMRLEGIVVVSFVLTQDGCVENAIIHTKSGSHTLDSKALKTVVALSGEYPHLNKKVDLQIPISFSLKNS